MMGYIRGAHWLGCIFASMAVVVDTGTVLLKVVTELDRLVYIAI